MRIRLTLDIERTPKPAPTEEPPVIYDLAGAQTERAGWQPTGFSVPNPSQEDT